MHIDYLTLKHFERMKGNEALRKQLVSLPCPDQIRFGLKYYSVPKDVKQFRESICWGQRLMMGSSFGSDLEAMLIYVSCYYQPIVTRKKYSEERAIDFFKKVVHLNVKELYPVCGKLMRLFEETISIEARKLNSTPDQTKRAAGIERLALFSDLSILEMMVEKARVSIHEVTSLEYNLVFSFLLKEKELNDFQDRYNELIMKKYEK